jgi:hypothetical protein
LTRAEEAGRVHLCHLKKIRNEYLMQHMRFMVLTGHLDDYSLPGLIKMLHGQRKTGRLQIDYAESPAAFYFEEGRLVDAKIGDLRGLEAVYLALSLAGASFNFNPLIKAPERTVADREQKLIQGLIEAPAGGIASDIPGTAAGERALSPLLQSNTATSLLPATESQPIIRSQVEERLIAEVGAALASHSKRFGRERMIYATVIAALLLLTFISWMRNDAPVAAGGSSLDTASASITPQPTAEAARSTETSNVRASISGQPAAGERRVREQPPDSPDANSAKRTERSDKQSKTTNAPAPARKNEPKTARSSPADDRDRRTVKVLLRVERGRVLNAVVQNPHAGMESFQALALRIARQRQYPKDFSGRDVLQIDVKP